MRRISNFSRMMAAALAAVAVLFFLPACGQPSPVESAANEPASTEEKPATDPAEPSEAETFSAIQNLLKGDQKRLASLERESTQLEKDFESTSAEFNRLDAAFPQERKAEFDETTPRAGLSETERAWADARDNFNVIIARRKAVTQQIETLKEKIALEEKTLEQLAKPEPEISSPASADPPKEESVGPTPDADTPAKETPANPIGLPLPLPSGVRPDAASSKADATAEPKTVLVEDAVIVDRQLADARKELAASEASLRIAESQVERLTEYETLFEKDLANAEALLEADRNALKIADQQLKSATAELAQTSVDDPEQRTRLTETQADARERLTEAQRNVTEHSARVSELQTQLEQIRTLQATAQGKVEEAGSAVDTARNWVRFYESPLAPHRLLEWITKRGPNVLVILLLMLLGWWLSRIIGKRVIAEIALRSRRGNAAEREMRADTLRRVFQSTASVAIIAVGALALLNQTGFDVTVLLGGAAVIGAAVAFGSQNLIKDYFSGFMILVENQYSVGNVIRIGDIAGTVEDVTLRMTVLRDLEGVVHFVPHSQVNTVSNLTHGWSRVVFDVGIGYGENVDRVMSVLMDLAHDLRDDETFGPMMLGEPEMLGVDQFADSAIVIRFLVKTRPLKQWNVKRELLRRIKNEFDKQGIEIPFPHRTVYHRDLDVRVGPSGNDPDERRSASRLDGMK